MIRDEAPEIYAVTQADEDEDALIAKALSILSSRLAQPGEALTSPGVVQNYLRLNLCAEPHEVFACLFLDTRHRVLAFEVLFHGSIDGAIVYPRQVIKRALAHNAGAVIAVHNHPSGVTDPSEADRTLTQRLKDALALVDVRLLDHMIVGGCRNMEITSLAEMGWV